MGGTSAAASGGADDEAPPLVESATSVASSCDASSGPSTSNPNPGLDSSFVPMMDDNYYDYMQGVEKPKVPYVGDKEPVSALVAEYETGSPIIQEKIKLLGEKYAALRRTRGDGNCFYRCFMFSYLEQILVTQNKAEVERVLVTIEQCKENLQSLGYAEFTYEDFFALFTDVLESCLQGTEDSLSLNELLVKARDQMISDCAVMFFRFITSAEMQTRAEFYQPFLSDNIMVQFCKTSVEPMGEESDNIHMIALSNALGVPIRVICIDSKAPEPGKPPLNDHEFYPSCDNNLQNNGSTDLSKKENYDLIVTLLYRPGHYDILYPI
ncbi:Ubiquitin thioesterase [Rhynchospora pubera]|uniref:ubiquitinyl hydrolase 1 n=1 Tax=Rhynchospora pubera TaxID=906938 RepID=A0AAV8E440_9POAL|nr:Ubiquitin thioesterase [Rhynchospora pubera]